MENARFEQRRDTNLHKQLFNVASKNQRMRKFTAFLTIKKRATMQVCKLQTSTLETTGALSPPKFENILNLGERDLSHFPAFGSHPHALWSIDPKEGRRVVPTAHFITRGALVCTH